MNERGSLPCIIAVLLLAAVLGVAIAVAGGVIAVNCAAGVTEGWLCLFAIGG